jgi:hypothetical protein
VNSNWGRVVGGTVGSAVVVGAAVGTVAGGTCVCVHPVSRTTRRIKAIQRFIGIPPFSDILQKIHLPVNEI